MMRSEGGVPSACHKSGARHDPKWSRDGRWIYLASRSTGRWEIWKIHPDGTSETQVTTTGGWVSEESPDGKYLYYKKVVSKFANYGRCRGGTPVSRFRE